MYPRSVPNTRFVRYMHRKSWRKSAKYAFGNDGTWDYKTAALVTIWQWLCRISCRFQWKPSRRSEVMASSVLTKASTGVKGTTGKKGWAPSQSMGRDATKRPFQKPPREGHPNERNPGRGVVTDEIIAALEAGTPTWRSRGIPTRPAM